MCPTNPAAEPLSPSHPDIGAQVAYAVEREGAKTVGDVLLRRTPVGLTHDLGRAAAPNVAAIMQDHFDWSDAKRDQAVRDYEMELHRTVTVFDHPNRRAATAPIPRTHAPDVAGASLGHPGWEKARSPFGAKALAFRRTAPRCRFARAPKGGRSIAYTVG